MTLILDPQPGESVYDPTCGTGGMLLSAAAELKRQGKEHRNLKLYGQELNLMTSAIARMSHGCSRRSQKTSVEWFASGPGSCVRPAPNSALFIRPRST